jgi:hypothetical protein
MPIVGMSACAAGDIGLTIGSSSVAGPATEPSRAVPVRCRAGSSSPSSAAPSATPGGTGIPVTGRICAGTLLTGRSNCGPPAAGAVRDGGRCDGGTAVGAPVEVIIAVRGPPTIGLSAVDPSPYEARPPGAFPAPGPPRRPRGAAMRESVSCRPRGSWGGE